MSVKASAGTVAASSGRPLWAREASAKSAVVRVASAQLETRVQAGLAEFAVLRGACVRLAEWARVGLKGSAESNVVRAACVPTWARVGLVESAVVRVACARLAERGRVGLAESAESKVVGPACAQLAPRPVEGSTVEGPTDALLQPRRVAT